MNETDGMDKQIRDAFREPVPTLPSNFAWRVRERIMAIRVRKARNVARLQSLGIGLLALMLAPLFFLMPGTDDLATSTSSSLASLPVAAIVVLVLVVALDAVLSARRSE